MTTHKQHLKLVKKAVELNAKGLTQNEIAAKLRRAQSTISRYLRESGQEYNSFSRAVEHDTVIYGRVSGALKDRLIAYCDRENLSQAKVLRMLVETFLDVEDA